MTWQPIINRADNMKPRKQFGFYWQYIYELNSKCNSEDNKFKQNTDEHNIYLLAKQECTTLFSKRVYSQHGMAFSSGSQWEPYICRLCRSIQHEWILNIDFLDLYENTTWLLDSLVLPALLSCYSHKPGFFLNKCKWK